MTFPYYMKSISKSNLVIILAAVALLQCTPKSEYKKLVERELSSQVKNDSLFLGTYFGMSSKDFYDHCWKLNKQGLIREGSNNTTVYYETGELPYKAAIEFYPRFQDGKIQSMTGHIHYKAWAPWNRHLWAEALIEDAKRLFETWYGGKFIPVKSPGYGKAYAKVDGNRRILLFYTKETRMEFLMTDLTNDDEIFANHVF